MARLQTGIAKKRMIRTITIHSENFFFFILVYFLSSKLYYLNSIYCATIDEKEAPSLYQIKIFICKYFYIVTI